MIEHVMRLCSDEGLVALLDHSLGDQQLRTAVLGRILARSGASLPSGTPISCLLVPAPLRPQWRRLCPPLDGSLYAQLVSMRELTDAEDRPADLLAEWLERMLLLDDRLGQV